jgi:hypothetical protein
MRNVVGNLPFIHLFASSLICKRGLFLGGSWWQLGWGFWLLGGSFWFDWLIFLWLVSRAFKFCSRNVIMVYIRRELSLLLELCLLVSWNECPVVLVSVAVILHIILTFLLDEVLYHLDLKVWIRPKLDHLLLFFVIDEHEHVETAEAADLNGFLEEASLPFAESNVPHVLVFYKK